MQAERKPCGFDPYNLMWIIPTKGNNMKFFQKEGQPILADGVDGCGVGERKTSVFRNGLIWFGAAVSIAEIEAGIQISSFVENHTIGAMLGAVLLGHLLGGLLLFGVGLIGARANCSAMDAIKIPFGKRGAVFFALMNLVQLVGWTAVMIAQGAQAGCALFPFSNGYMVYCIGIALLIVVWLFMGGEWGGKLNSVAMGLLFVACLFLLVKLFGESFGVGGTDGGEGETGFWDIVKTSVAMPISWLPLIADYTRNAKKPVMTAAISSGVYSVASSWMYVLGVGIAVGLGQKTIAEGFVVAGIGVVGLFVVIFSTVTTTFLDVYSAGESAKSILGKIDAKKAGLVVCGVGMVLAMVNIMDHYIDFLCFIASVFAPMAAVQLMDWFVWKRRVYCRRRAIVDMVAWAAGFCIYQWVPSNPFPTTASMVVAALVTCAGLVWEEKKEVEA